MLNIIWRLTLLMLSGAGMIYLVLRMRGGEWVFTLIVGILLILIQVFLLTRYVLGINNTLISFIDSVGLSSAPELQFRAKDPLLSGLQSSLNQLKSEISRTRFEEQKQKSLLDIVVGTMDTGLICVNEKQELVFSNKAAADLLNPHPGIRPGDPGRLNPLLSEALESSRSGKSGVVEFPRFKATVRCNSFILDNQRYALYSIQNIQREIDAQESESWQKLIRVLTHEIMNSMGPILSLSKSLQKSVDQPEKVISGLATIEGTGEGLLHFITEYRRLSNLPLPEMGSFRIANLFDRIQSLYAEEFRHNQVQFSTVMEEADLQLVADMNQIEMILINLVKNAVESLRLSDARIVTLSAGSEGGRTLITVEDNGPGIPQEMKDQVFVPFFSTKKTGTGIGLSLSRQIMNNHHGTIHFSSIPGERTAFTLTF